MPDRLGVHVLGPFRLDGVDVTALRSRQARTVLKVLAVAGGSTVTAGALVEAVWPNALPADPDRDLAVLVSRVRSLLGPERIERGDAGYRLVADWFDRAELQALAGEAASRDANGDLAAARATADAALALASGELLAGEPDADWVKSARADAARDVAVARSIAARSALAAGLPVEALRHGHGALDHDPYDEAALRVVMAAHVAAGRPASALAEYAAMRARLTEELGVNPSAETAALHAAVLVGNMPPHRRPLGGSTRLVGRAGQLEQLDAALARSRAEAVVIAIVGEVGVGKTALADAFAGRAAAAGVGVLRGRCAEGIDLALQPIADALAAIDPLDSDATIHAADSGGVPWTSLPGPLATSEALRRGVFDVLAQILRRLTTADGLVVIVDDAHRADPVTIGWLGHLTRRRHELPVLVLTTRPGNDDVDVPSTDVIELHPLDEGETAELVGTTRAGELYRRAGGNPLLLTELAAARGDDLPATIRETVAGRLRRSGDAATTLRAAAVLGPDVDLDLLAGVLDAPPLVVLEHLDEGHRHSFLVERNGVTSFRHDVVREAIVGDTAVVRRTWLHQQAARLLSARPNANPLEVARHANASGDHERAATALAAAADIARTRFDLDGAEQLFEAAIAVHDGTDLRLRRSRLRIARNDVDGADADAEAALGAGAAALELRAWAARNRHDMTSAIRLGTAGAATATDPTTKASCLVAVALAQRGLGELAAADATMAAAAAVAPPSLGVGGWVGVLRVHQGRGDEALTALQPLIGAEADGMTFWVEHVLQMAAHANGILGRVGDALTLLERLDVELRRRGSDVRYGGLPHNYRCWLLRNLESPLAEDEARAGLALATMSEVRAQAQLDLADTLLRLGRLDEAAGALTAATAEIDGPWFNNRWRAEQRAMVISARLHLAAGDPTSALSTVEGVAETASGRGDARYETVGRLVTARALARLGRPVAEAPIAAALSRLPHVAALEAWWLAADLADDTGFASARAAATTAGQILLAQAGEHAENFRRVLDGRLS